ncbi:tRNA pseudouridine(13) synthase TruD [Persicimonas caeni]|uniref:tRNA pseudouridine synthase D n=1 Tax=Persicimonas caeni TaxID=2292766 RepID=A0A4Y6PNM2_PERCE|nr:tRNA pseudouridine(13) synthase TruD [Persicimonas caeni]QDG49918.1 tRNA pseudouridine(13) synthase TruD [Persicimonas caeni]QED31139.1 tRNA pseudouridine(13) synthase TruD [Persicimonas caeni]
MKVTDRPYLTAGLPGIGGEIKCEIDDFEVEEVPLYEPGGDGQHAYVWLEKRGVPGGKLVSMLAAHFGVKKRDIGTAGIKDKHAVTRQWVSLPFHELEQDEPSDLVGPVVDGVEVLEARLHRNKLRTGHLEGNRFQVVVRNFDVPADEALERAQAVLEVLGAKGMPNYFGLQRFGNGGSTLELGVGYLKGDADAKRRLKRNHFLRRLSVSAVQSELFNRVLAARIDRELLWTLFDGDVVKKTDTGGVFVVPTDEFEETQARLDRGELVTTGPLPGPRMIAPERDGKVFEDEVLSSAEVDDRDFARHKKLAPGARRPLLVDVGEPSVRIETRDGQEVLVVGFFLPSGTYATVLLREITKHADLVEA